MLFHRIFNPHRFVFLFVCIFIFVSSFLPLHSYGMGKGAISPLETQWLLINEGAEKNENENVHFNSQNENDEEHEESSSCSCLQSSRWLKRSLGKSIALFCYTGTSCGLFLQKYFEEKEKGKSETHCISEGCTYALQYFIIPTVALPTLRATLSYLKSTRVGEAFALSDQYDYHKLFAGIFGSAAIAHGACRIIHNPSVLTKQEGISGMAMVGSFLIPMGSAYLLSNTCCLKGVSSYVNKVIRPHQIGFIVLLVGYAVHKPSYELVPWALIPFGEVLLDRIAEYAILNHYTELRSTEEVSQDRLRIAVGKPEGFSFQAGDYVYLNILGHPRPFTISRATDTDLYFDISVAGPGTKELLEFARELPKEPNTYFHPVTLTGPYHSQRGLLPKNNHSILILTAGSGQSVASSVLEAAIKENSQVRFTLIHSERTPENFGPLLEQVRRAKEAGVSIAGVLLHLTGQAQGPHLDLEGGSADSVRDLASVLSQFEETMAFENIDLHQAEEDELGAPASSAAPCGSSGASSKIPVLVQFERINFKKFHPESKKEKPMVILCGNPKFCKQAEKACSRFGLTIKKESFEF